MKGTGATLSGVRSCCRARRSKWGMVAGSGSIAADSDYDPHRPLLGPWQHPNSRYPPSFLRLLLAPQQMPTHKDRNENKGGTHTSTHPPACSTISSSTSAKAPFSASSIASLSATLLGSPCYAKVGTW